jgi:hypothetical protein
MACLFIAVGISSCGNGNSNVVNPSSANTKLIVINASPDVGPLTAFVNNVQLGSNSNLSISRTFFKYTTLSSYYGINSGIVPIQIRTDHNVGLITIPDSTIQANVSYSIFLTGLFSTNTLKTIFVADTSSIPALGRGKIRFINASPGTPAFDLSANGTPAFSKIPYLGFSNYIELPAGTYDFKVTANGTPNSTLVELPLTTIQDGRLYTIYTKGLVGRTDSAALSLTVIINK